MAAAAVVTQPATTAISSPLIVSKREHPEVFFGRIFICLKARQLPQALEILLQGKPSIHRTLIPNNIAIIAGYISSEQGTPEDSASGRCKRMRKAVNLYFSDVLCKLQMIKKKVPEVEFNAVESEQRLEQFTLNEKMAAFGW